LDLIGVLTFPNVVRLKADHAGRMVGFIAGDIRNHERISWIATIGVLPEYRGRGIGKQLLEACENKLPTERIRLCVRISNDVAIQMYRQNGYDTLTTWTKYYQDGEDALVMEKIRL
jgi:ribosomal-protein-alanine N-acetyltransferase